MSVGIFFTFMFAMKSTLRGMNYNDWDRGVLETVSDCQ